MAEGAPLMVRVGFIGLGAMGEPMARALLRAGFAVTACAHRRREALERLTSQGAAQASDPAGVAERSDLVAICVPDAPQVEDVLFGERGVERGARNGSLAIDMSTISPIASRRFARRLRERGIGFVDAPVSGGPQRAESGTLTIMAGGDDADVSRALPVLRALGTPTHLGGVGMGETVKLVNQAIIANVMLGNVEALVLAQRLGAQRDAVRSVLATATASNYLLEQWLPKTWFAGTFDGGFSMDLLRKDLAAALDAAGAIEYAMPATANAYALFTAASSHGNGALDYSAIANDYERTDRNAQARNVS
ncbi:MAG: NAD(P)-dependent oxidoreductase [Candidatus Tyrphobacter sp.]